MVCVSSKMSSSTEELDLLERVFLRVGSAESDEQLESAINKFLIPVLLKLSSPNEGVRKKVMELLVHINKRVKRQPTVQLPVEALLTQYRDPKATSFFINFSILYIKLGFPRLPASQQEKLAPALLLATEGRPKTHQDGIFLLLATILGNIKVPPDPEEVKKFFGMKEKPELMKHFLSFMLDMLLLPYVHISPNNEESSTNSSQTTQAPPGMSEYGFKRVTSSDTPMTAEKLEETKQGIVKFLATGIFSPNEIICHLIIAAADTRFTVANLADSELKRISGSVNWSSVSVASSLFHLYLGSPEVPAEKRNLIPPANRVTPANTRFRLKILPYLCRLEKDAILFPACVQVIFNSLYDANTNAKLKVQALNFALAIVTRSDIQTMKKMGGIMYTGLLKIIWNQQETDQLRIIGYTIVAQIIKRLPRIINKSLIELQAFFENLSLNSIEVRQAVRDALITMIDSFKLVIKEDHDPKSITLVYLLTILAAQVESKEPMARFVAVKYTAAAFDPDEAASRYLLLLCSGDSNSDVSSVALQSIYGFAASEGTKKKMIFPDFKDMCYHVYERAMERMKNVNERVTIQNHILPFNEATFNEILTYLRLCLANSAGIDIKDKQVLTHPCESSPVIRNYILKTYQASKGIFDKYLSLIEMFLKATSSPTPLNSLIEVVGTSPELFAVRYSEKLRWVMNFLNNTKEEIREAGSIFLSIITVNAMNDDAISAVVRDLMGKLNGKTLETQHGVILGLGYLIERKIFKTIEDGLNFQDVIKNWEFLGIIIKEIFKHLEGTHPMLMSASCVAFGQISKVLPLPIPNESEYDLSKKKVMNILIDIINNPKISGKIKENAIRTCGLLCLGENFPYTKELIEAFISIGKQTKDIDIHFTLGESLVLCIEGISSSEKCDAWKKEKSQYDAPPILEENLALLNSLIDKFSIMIGLPHPNTRQAVCVFLMCIIKRLSHLSVVKEKITSIQFVFMELLSENNELVQDIASKGLALVYESTSEENKKKLVGDLLDQLLAGKRTVEKVTENTKIFEEGQLGVSPTGGNLSTYKELCSLASDLNQPDLIYKFMHLANHNAVWNSKKGAAFGFQTIVSQAEDQLNEYLPKIIPRLYRYQFDPTPRIQQSMSNIWHSLVKSHQKTLDKYYNEILEDLLSNLTSNQWRVRISCCLALADFFRGSRSLLDAKPKLPELWKSLFRVMDDVHEGTRLAAQSTGKTLANLHVKLCDKESGKINQEMLDISLSIFLSQITNSVAEVKNICLHTLSQLVNSAGPSLKPNLLTLIPSLVEASGELESLGLSYLSAQYGAQAQTQEVIDVVRANAAKSHYTTQTVTKCVQYVDAEMMEGLVPRIAEIMKSPTFGSRIACAHLIVLLAHHLGRSMEQYTGKFLLGLVNGLLDRNATVRKTYASAIGQIVHTAKPSTVEKLLTKLSNWYFEKEDINTRTAVGHAIQSVAHYNGELLREKFPIVIPLIFFAMHGKKVEGEDNSSVILWEEIWNDVSPGSESGIRQHMNEICGILETALNSSSWTMKAQGGRCVSTIAVKIPDTIEPQHRDKLIELTLSALQGKTFPGKEDILKSVAKLASQCAESLKKDPETCKKIVEAILRECGKSEPTYKRHGVEALGTVLEAFDNIDYFEKVYEIIQNILKKLDEKGDGETSAELTKKRNEKYKTLEIIYETLGKSWPMKKETQIKYEDVLLNECYKALETSPRDVQVAILSAFRCYIEKLHYFNEESNASSEEKEALQVILQKTTQALHYSLGIPKHTRLRKEALNIVYTLGNKLNKTGRKDELKSLREALRGRLQELEKDSTPEIRTRLMDLKDLYKN